MSKNLRIGVESVDVEIDDDSGILWTSLQTAFPGCSGMYYYQDRTQPNPVKKSVKFDGSKFRAPSGTTWQDFDFYVTLSQRCHSAGGGAHQNGQTYSEATKQFEKSVQAVQKMMVASGMKIDLSHLQLKKPRRQIASTNSSTSSEESTNTLQNIQTRLENKADDLTQLEQHFLDLARISTAKDEIIQANRAKIAEISRDSQGIAERLREFEAKCAAQEEELAILRGLGGEFGATKEDLAELVKQRAELETAVTELQLKLMQTQEENESNRGRLETSQNRIKELADQLELLQTSKSLLNHELSQLRPFAEAAAIEDFSEIPKFIATLDENRKLREELAKKREESEMTRGAFDELNNVQTPIFEENLKLRKRNDDLSRRFEHVDEEIKCLNENWAKEMREKTNDWMMLRTELENEILQQREQIQHLQHFLEAATREAAENARRISEIETASAKKTATQHASRVETELREKVRNLSEDLSESQRCVADLNILVANLASDANMSRRDISDLL
ncbi:unnamed protein product [Caenorhabditis angaria]|uniref:TAR DNA-binding protein 43 N-terminal domain-containing protein n=1 Tax=Caenorhabditis angaria TaxID=860376 RepID=A0A9P1MUQ1_9PELO|nr:unnamed protein product [Caenorhabditis angaria]